MGGYSCSMSQRGDLQSGSYLECSRLDEQSLNRVAIKQCNLHLSEHCMVFKLTEWSSS
jgi:hypothetical protein